MQVRKNHTTFFFILIVTILLSAYLRSFDMIRGTDALAYIDLFDSITSYNKLNYQYYMNDYGFSHYSFLIRKITDSGVLYLFITFFLSTLFLFTSYYIFLKEEQSSFLYISIFFLLFSSSYYLMNLNGVRQGFSSSLIMLSFAYCYEMKNTKAITLMLVAISFHKSALLALATLFIITQPWIRISPVLIFYFLTIIGLLFNSEQIIILFNDAGLDVIAEKFKSFNRVSKGNTSVTFKLFVLFTFVNFFAYIRSYTTNQLFNFVTRVYIIYAGIVMLFCSFEAFVNRLLLIFGVIEPLIFALSIYCFKDKRKVMPFILLFGIIYFVYVFTHPSFRSELRLLDISFPI
jgi:hypothetical protein